MSKKDNIESNWIKLLTWTIMDGTLVDGSKYAKHPEKSSQKRIQFKLSKTRKLVSLMKLLNDMKVPYTVQEATKSGENKLQPYIIRIYGDEAKEVFARLKGNKTIPDSWGKFDRYQMNIFLKTLEETDGCRTYNRIAWAAKDSNSMGVVKSLLKNHGIQWSEGYTVSGFNKENKIPRMSIEYKLEWYETKQPA